MMAATTIQIELIPMAYTNPGPPTKPNPLSVVENTAKAVTIIPRSRPAIKKSWEDLVRLRAQIPTTIHKIMYIAIEVNITGLLKCSIPIFDELIDVGQFGYDLVHTDDLSFTWKNLFNSLSVNTHDLNLTI